MALQDELCGALESMDGSRRVLPGRTGRGLCGGLARPRVPYADGPNIEKAAVQFTHGIGHALPPAATERNPELAGRGFQAASISVIVHPRNPHAPTTHMNLRFFMVDGESSSPVDPDGGKNRPVWYFGGGFDLTPFYPYEEDCVHWHRMARNGGRHTLCGIQGGMRRVFPPPPPATSAGVSAGCFSTIGPRVDSTAAWRWSGRSEMLFCRHTGPSSNGAPPRLSATGSDSGSFTGAAAMPSSTSRSTAAPVTACRAVAGSSPYWHPCRPWSPGVTARSPEKGSPEAELMSFVQASPRLAARCG